VNIPTIKVIPKRKYEDNCKKNNIKNMKFLILSEFKILFLYNEIALKFLKVLFTQILPPLKVSSCSL